MNGIKKYISRIRTSVTAMGWRRGLAASLLVLLVIGGGFWLVWEYSSTAASKAKQPETARRMPAPAASRDEQATLTLGELAGQDDLWRTHAQNTRRYQIALMNELSRQISSLPSVKSATVILSSGSPGKIGRAKVASSAAVKVTLDDHSKMTHRMACAIADLVSGSIAGMKSRDVRIVDNTGGTWRIDESFSHSLALIRRSEAYHVERIRAALDFIDNVIVNVRVAEPNKASGKAARCLGASVSVPRSYLEAAYKLLDEKPSNDGLGQFIDSQLASIRGRVMRASGINDARAVNVEWHRDVDFVAQTSEEKSSARSEKSGIFSPGILAACGLAMVLIGATILWRRTICPVSPVSESSQNNIPSADVQDESENPLAFLRDVSGGKLLELLRDEHPQTVALVLDQVGPGKAAVVLAGLDPEKQVEVIRRVAGLTRPGAEVIREIAGGLAERIDRYTQDGRKTGGVSTAAKILHHAGYAAEKSVLAGLSNNEPDLADSISRNIFEFDDIVSLSDHILREALADVEDDEIAVALRTASRDIRDKILGSLCSDRAERVREEMDMIGPVRLSDVEAAQQRLAIEVRRVEAGQFVADRSVVANHDIHGAR